MLTITAVGLSTDKGHSRGKESECGSAEVHDRQMNEWLRANIWGLLLISLERRMRDKVAERKGYLNRFDEVGGRWTALHISFRHLPAST